MDRLFLDANVLFSAAYGSSGLGRLWHLAADKRCCLVSSRFAFEEARRNLEQESHRRDLEEYLRTVELVEEVPPNLPCNIKLPDKDVPIWLAAVAAGASHLITGDVQHFGSYFNRTFQGITVLLPRDYLRLHD